MTLKQYVISHVNPDDYYASRFPRWNPNIRGNVPCIFHDDDKPSLAISLRNGGARCHASNCAERIGNIVHFESKRTGVSERIVARKLYREFVRKVISKKTIAEYRQQLMTNGEYLLKVRKEMGLNLSTIRNYSLGYDSVSRRVTIPVYDAFGQCVNIRFYRLPSDRTDSDQAKLHNLKGCGQASLFPEQAIANFVTAKPVFVMASEKESLIGIQAGLQCVCSTTGEGTWLAGWTERFAKFDLYSVYDRDTGGDAARDRLSKILPEVRHIKLKFKQKRKDRKDYADWVIKDRNDAKALSKYAKRVVPSRDQESPSEDEDRADNPSSAGRRLVDLPKFADRKLHEVAEISSRSDLLNRRVRITGIVAAKSPNTFSIPYRFRVTTKAQPAFDYAVPFGRELLRFVRSPDGQILQSLQKLVGSTSAEFEPLEYITATEVEVIPTAVADRDVPYVVQRCYYFGERIESNIPYEMEVIPTSEIRTQETIGIITSIIPLSKSIDKFEMTPEMEADLSYFQPEGGEVWDKLVSLADEISNRFTYICNRLDWHLVALLTWASPIGWRFPNDPQLQRGWLNSLALGDTETGKSNVCKTFQRLFNCGVFVSSENCTYVGLVGGAIKMGSGQLMLRWGRIPLSDKQLVVLEELSGLSIQEIANMSDVRSSGVARLDKGGINAETQSRTRLLCLSNVRHTRRTLSNYLFGVHAVQELIGHSEDIARFDLITTLIDREVSVDLINSKDRFATGAKGDMSFATDQIQKLIHFIWSLTPDKIKFTEDAFDECLEQTKKFATEYHPSIPIFKGGAGRNKLGRIAASIACLQFSWTNGQIEVNSSHVRAAARLLRLIYDKPSFGYREYSRQMFDRERIKDESLVRKAIVSRIAKDKISKALEALIHSTRFTKDELCAFGELNNLNADQLIGVMARERVISKGEANVWEITVPGKNYLETLMHRYQKYA